MYLENATGVATLFRVVTVGVVQLNILKQKNGIQPHSTGNKKSNLRVQVPLLHIK